MSDEGDGSFEADLTKTGAELFRELLRIMGDAEVEDYYKGGAWLDDLVRLDIQLVTAHRSEGGAPDPPPLEEVPMPELPTAVAGGLQLPPGGLAEALAKRVAALRGGNGTAGASPVQLAKKDVEPNDSPDWLDVALKKSGAELFREFLRVMSDADEEDYIKGGSILDDLLRLDLQLVVAHRMQGGAEEVPSLQDVREPKFPATSAATTLLFKGAAGTVLGSTNAATTLAARVAALKAAAAASSGAIKPAAGGAAITLKPLAKNIFGAAAAASKPAVSAPVLKPPSLITSAASARGASAAAGAGGAAGAPAAEQRLISLFVAKWKLVAARCNQVLGQLSPPRRRFVIQKFKTTDAGQAAMEHLETFIAECELTDAWGAAEKLSASAGQTPIGQAKTPVTLGLPRFTAPSQALGQQTGDSRGLPIGFKRPLTPVALGAEASAAKRPRLGVHAAPAGGALSAAAIALRLAAAKAAASGGAQQMRANSAAASLPRLGAITPPRIIGGPIRPPQAGASGAANKPGRGNMIRNLLARV